MCVLLFTHTISIADSIEIIKNESDDFSMLGEYYFFGTLIGKISNLDRFSNKEYISFQAENTRYKGTVIIRPPNVIDELEGVLYSGEVKIFWYFGLITRNFIFAYVVADSHVFYS